MKTCIKCQGYGATFRPTDTGSWTGNYREVVCCTSCNRFDSHLSAANFLFAPQHWTSSPEPIVQSHYVERIPEDRIQTLDTEPQTTDNLSMKITKELVQKYHNAEGLTDKELEALIQHYEDIERIAVIQGDKYALIAFDAITNIQILKRFKFHREFR